jgi:hypothetical protein
MVHTLEEALGGVPDELRTRIATTYAAAKSAYAKREFDACVLRAGKCCEVVLRYLQSSLTGHFTPFGTKLGSFTDECRRLERSSRDSGPEAFRLLIPRALDFVYSLRNKRDVGHVGGDLLANEIDAATAIRLVDWCIAEVIRTTHTLSLQDAQRILDAIAERQLPAVWSVNGHRRVMVEGLTQSEETLVLLYSARDGVLSVDSLVSSIEPGRVDNYRARVLSSLHADRMVEYDREGHTVTLTPRGVERAEELIGLQRTK